MYKNDYNKKVGMSEAIVRNMAGVNRWLVYCTICKKVIAIERFKIEAIDTMNSHKEATECNKVFIAKLVIK